LKLPTHVAGTFLIHADASFLNGAGLGEGENRNVTVPKTLRDHKDDVPYVSSQAWKRWLRNTLIDETGWEASELVSIKKSDKESTSKIAGKLDLVMYPEDDLFGYMRAQEGQGKAAKKEPGAEEEVEEAEEDAAAAKAARTKALVRASPFSASLLVSVRKKGWKGHDEGFVHLKEGTPLPYSTEFYTTHLQGVFCLAHYRVGRFENTGDRIELEESNVKKYAGKLKGQDGIFELIDAVDVRRERSGALLKALAVLRGGAKQAAFGTDVAPKFLLLAGLSCGNPIFNHLFTDEPATGLVFKTSCFLEVLKDYADRITTPVHIGLRAGYVGNEDEIRSLAKRHEFGDRGTVEVAVSTPREAAESVAKLL
jgi:CRISPR-associated protein Cst2